MNLSRFARHADERLDARIEADMRRIIQVLTVHLPHGSLFAVYLSGEFASGDGAACITQDTVTPGSTYEVCVVVTPSCPLPVKVAAIKRLPKIAQMLEKELDISLRFIQTLRPQQISSLPFTLTWFSMQHNGYAFLGPVDTFAPLPPMPVDKIPVHEGAKLLASSAVQLYAARRALARGEENACRLAHHTVHRTILALGDALLILLRQYHPKRSARMARLLSLSPEQLGPCPELANRYAEVAGASLCVIRYWEPEEAMARIQLCIETFEMMYPFLMEKVLGGKASTRDELLKLLQQSRYTGQQRESALKNIIMNLYSSGWRALFSRRFILRHPRHRLFTAIAAMRGDGDDKAMRKSLALPWYAGVDEQLAQLKKLKNLYGD